MVSNLHRRDVFPRCRLHRPRIMIAFLRPCVTAALETSIKTFDSSRQNEGASRLRPNGIRLTPKSDLPPICFSANDTEWPSRHSATMLPYSRNDPLWNDHQHPIIPLFHGSNAIRWRNLGLKLSGMMHWIEDILSNQHHAQDLTADFYNTDNFLWFIELFIRNLRMTRVPLSETWAKSICKIFGTNREIFLIFCSPQSFCRSTCLPIPIQKFSSFHRLSAAQPDMKTLSDCHGLNGRACWCFDLICSHNNR
jgi:hypothetical protein